MVIGQLDVHGLGASNQNTMRQLALTRMLHRPARSPRSGRSRRYARSCGTPRADSERQEDEARSREDRTWSGGLMGTNMPAGNR